MCETFRTIWPQVPVGRSCLCSLVGPNTRIAEIKKCRPKVVCNHPTGKSSIMQRMQLQLDFPVGEITQISEIMLLIKIQNSYVLQCACVYMCALAW